MTPTRAFQSGNSQAVSIPKELRTEKTEFSIKRVGDAFILFPADDPWFPLRATIGTFQMFFWKTETSLPLLTFRPGRDSDVLAGHKSLRLFDERQVSFPEQKTLTVPASELTVSSVALLELEYGTAKANWGVQKMEDLRLFLSAFHVLLLQGTMQ